MDLNVLNSLAEERNQLQEANRELTQRLQTAERKLSAIDTDQAQARKALEQREEARRDARRARKELEVAIREHNLDRMALSKALSEVESYKKMLQTAGEAYDALKAEIRDLKNGARLVGQGLERELAAAKAKIRELEPAAELVADYRRAHKRLLG